MKTILQKEIETDEGGAWLKCYVPNFKEIKKYFINDIALSWIEIDDNRKMSSEQRKKIYALFKDISDWSGHYSEEIKDIMKTNFIEDNGRDYFSLANIDMTYAKNFIEFILDFCFEKDVSLKLKTAELMKDEYRFLYGCLKKRRCCVASNKCSKDVERHHATNLVGMGNKRSKHDHENSTYMALCKKHHTEIDHLGLDKFCDKYHVKPIKLTKEQIKELGI